MTKSRDLGNLANGTFTGDIDVTGSVYASTNIVKTVAITLRSLQTLRWMSI